METTVRLGRVLGIRIGANWSFVFIFALITWSLAAGVLPAIVADQPALAYWVVAAMIAVLFFTSLIAHEMAHALVARHHGIQVDEITLWLLGGVSKLERDPTSPRVELHIAVAGPLTSFVVGLGWFAVAIVAETAGAPGLVVTAFVWLALINGTLAVFNLLPAFPLDGGRVLRAFLWSHGTSRMDATARAERVGGAVAYGLMGLGFLEVLSGGGIGGLWLVLIGWFVLAASRAETEAVREQELLEGTKVRDVMTPSPDVVPAELDVASFVDDYVISGGHTSYPVVDRSGHAVGLITIDRVRSVPPDRRSSTSLRQVAIARDDLPTVSPDAPAVELIPPLVQGPARKLLVFDGDQLVGIVTAADIARTLHDRALRASLLPPAR